MRDKLDEILKSSSTFASLDDESREGILSFFIQVDLAAKEILFYQGDPSDSVYLLVSGKLSAELTTVGTGKTHIVGYINPGETVGELGALSNEARSLTIKALKDSILLKISAADFLSITHQHPSVMFAIVRPIISRSVSLIQALSKEKRSKHIVIVPANRDVSLQAFSEKFYEITENFPSTLVVSDYQADFSDKTASVSAVNEKIQRLTAVGKSKHRIVYLLSAFDTPLAKVAFKHADMIFIAAHANTIPKIDAHILDKIDQKKPGLHQDPSLIFLNSNDQLSQSNILDWLNLTHFGLHHHVRMNITKDFQRLFRFVRGKAVGLVLSGGGTRGWAHIGAIRAIREARIPIDIVGGTSAGAVVGGIYALTQSHEEVYSEFSKLVKNSTGTINWRSLTWPLISLFSAEKFTRAQMDVFGENTIENLELPFFCVTANLATYSEDIHRSGLLWQKVRASTSIPGIIPPMVLDGEMHLDGGLLNNLPADVMRKYLGEKGKIIAIELNDIPLTKTTYNFPPILKFKDILLNKLSADKKNKYPPFMDTFLRSIFLGSSLKARQNAMAANIFVSLNLAEYGMLHPSLNEGEKLFEIGYKETMKHIIRTKNKNILPG